MELCERRTFLLVMLLVGSAIYIALCAWRFSTHDSSICYLTEHHAFLKRGVKLKSHHRPSNASVLPDLQESRVMLVDNEARSVRFCSIVIQIFSDSVHKLQRLEL
jgi:hypothetical protein